MGTIFKSLHVFMLLAAFWALPGHAAMEIWAGVTGSGSQDASMPFKDLMWATNPVWEWVDVTDPGGCPGFFGGTDEWPWTCDYNQARSGQIFDAVPKTDRGYPRQVPFTFNGKQYRPVLGWLWMIPEKIYPFGTFTFICEGKGTVVFGWDHRDTLNLTGGKKVYNFKIDKLVNPVVPGAGGFANGEAFNAGQGNKSHGLMLTITSTDSDDPVRNFHLIRPDKNGGTSYVDNFEQCPFTEGWLEDHRVFRVLRYMDWLHANHNDVVQWKDRIGPHYSLGWKRKSDPAFYIDGELQHTSNWHMPWEMIIKASNIMGNNPWITIPVKADDEYVRNVARLFKDNLDPELHVWVEWGNETWNGIFIGAHATDWVKNKHNSNVVNREDAHAASIVRIGKIFHEVFGAEKNRVKTVACGFFANPGVGDNIMASLKKQGINPENFKVDGYAVAPYFAPAQGPDVSRANSAVATARNNGVLPLLYEGGTEAGQGPAMYDAIKNALTTLSNAGMYNFNAFIAVAGWGAFGNWGFKEYVGQPLSEAHKYRALYDWAVTNKQFDPNSSIQYCPESLRASSPFMMPAERIGDRRSSGIHQHGYTIRGQRLTSPGARGLVVIRAGSNGRGLVVTVPFGPR